MKKITLSFACLATLAASAQFDQNLTQFSTNYSQFNPAATGLFHRVAATASYQNLYASLSGNYVGYSGGYQQQIACLKGGLGVNYNYDPVGRGNSHQRLAVNYAYQLELNEDSKISFGVGAGLRRFSRETTTATNNTVDGPQSYTLYGGSGFVPMFNLGTMYKSKHLAVGFSVTQLNDKDLHLVTSENPFQSADYPVERNLYVNAAYTFDLGEKFQLEPQILYHYVGGFQSLTTGVLATYNKQYWLGAQLQNRDGVAAMAGVDIAQRFRVGYSYNVTLSRLNNGTSGGSHELVFRYAIPYGQ